MSAFSVEREVIVRLVQVSALSVKQERIARKDQRNVRIALLGIIVPKSHLLLWFVQLEIIARLVQVSTFSVEREVIARLVQVSTFLNRLIRQSQKTQITHC